MKLLIIFLQKHGEDIITGSVGAGAFTLLLTEINLILKILVATATLIFFGIKIYKEFKK